MYEVVLCIFEYDWVVCDVVVVVFWYDFLDCVLCVDV